jgi:hypothetical protein
MFTIAKVVKAYRTLPDGSRDNTIAFQPSNGELIPIANLKSYKMELERLAGDEEFDKNYCAIQIINREYYYVPVEDLQSIINKLEQKDKIVDFVQLMEDLGTSKLLKLLPCIQGINFGKEKSFVIF